MSHRIVSQELQETVRYTPPKYVRVHMDDWTQPVDPNNNTFSCFRCDDEDDEESAWV